MTTPANLAPVSWDRMIRAVEKVRDRLLRAANTLEQAGVPYAVAGGNAVAAWVSRMDEAAVRNTRDIAILLRRSDLEAARHALESVGFSYRKIASLGQPEGLHLFLDHGQASVRDAVHIVFAMEKVRPDSPVASPDVTDSESADRFRVVTLEALIRMKLAAFRDKDRTHLRDLIEVGLLDATFLDRLEPALRERLNVLLTNPEA